MTRTILVVDDEQDIRRLATLSLTRVGGFTVSEAGSGSECLAALTGPLPDLVILDVMMPVMDGPTTLAAIRDDPHTRSVPVVFLTAGVVSTDIERLRALEVSGVLQKPFDPLTLPASVVELLGW